MTARDLAGLRWMAALAGFPGGAPAGRDVIRTEASRLAHPADYFAIAATPRFRASQRARLRAAARQSVVLVVLTALLDSVWLVPFHLDAIAALIGLNAAVALTAVGAYRWMARHPRRHPVPPVIVVLAVVDVATIMLGISHPAFGLVTAGYLLLLPTFVALVLPWSTRSHVAWLALHATATIGYILVASGGILPGGRDEMLTLLLLATAVSQFGHVSALRARIISFVQIERIRALNRQARRDARRLDRLNAILDLTARTDELTGLKNRLSLRRDLRAVRGRIKRHAESYGLLVLDLDRFKAINDARGHVAGDGVLRAVADALFGAVRAEDGAYRYGGEEFVVVMEVGEPAEAYDAAERIRHIVEDLRLPNPGNPPYGCVTVSVGVACVGTEDLGADDDAWFSRADAALYRAKGAGRNRSAGESEPVAPG